MNELKVGRLLLGICKLNESTWFFFVQILHKYNIIINLYFLCVFNVIFYINGYHVYDLFQLKLQ